MGAEFVRGRVCQGPSLLGAEMSRNRLKLSGKLFHRTAAANLKLFLPYFVVRT